MPTAPAVLYRAQHTGELGLPMTFLHPYQRAPTRFVCFQAINPRILGIGARIMAQPQPLSLSLHPKGADILHLFM